MAKEQPADQAEHGRAPHESEESLWLLIAGPLIWSAHFVLSYITAAIWCAKVAGRTGPLGPASVAVGAYTLAALAGIVYTAWRGYRMFSLGRATVHHDFDTRADRHRFLGFATALLSGLSFVATVYVGMSVVFIRSCL